MDTATAAKIINGLESAKFKDSTPVVYWMVAETAATTIYAKAMAQFNLRQAKRGMLPT